MNKSTTIVIVLILIVAAVGGFWWFASGQEDREQTDSSEQTVEPRPADGELEQQPDADGVMPESVITYTENGFELSSDTVSAGSEIQIINQSSGNLDFASDEHPQHTDNPELNVGIVSPGESITFSISQTGTWGFHNHLNASHEGSITVTD